LFKEVICSFCHGGGPVGAKIVLFNPFCVNLALKGLEVNICEAPEFKDAFATTLDRQQITLIDAEGAEKTARLALATTDFAAALKGVDYIMLPIPATGQERFLGAIMPHLEDGQTIVGWPGNYGSLYLARLLKEAGIKKDVTIAESHTLPWGCRMEAPGRIKIFVDAWKLLLAALPSGETVRVVKDIKDYYPVAGGSSVLETSLNNLNPIVHPVGTLLNAGAVDSRKGEFHLYRDGTTPSIARAIKAVFEEVSRVGKVVGVKMLKYPEKTFNLKSTIMSHYFKAPGDMEATVAHISGPAAMTSRYITEDIPYGLVPVAGLACSYGVDIPIIDATICLASVVNRADYYEMGRSLGELGIAGLNREELDKALKEGF
jgi:opine dehydrogenase